MLTQNKLDETEKEVVMETMKTKVGKIQIGAFLAFLDNDNIEGITKNTVGWLDNFRGLVTNG